MNTTRIGSSAASRGGNGTCIGKRRRAGCARRVAGYATDRETAAPASDGRDVSPIIRRMRRACRTAHACDTTRRARANQYCA
ncbi:hypothetical protein C6Q21_29585 [Burkholderia multivorans]|nr:hypothetical protein C6Q21_29585 [Burkholderia multivorans]